MYMNHPLPRALSGRLKLAVISMSKLCIAICSVTTEYRVFLVSVVGRLLGGASR